MSLLVQNKPCLKNGSWEPLLGNLCLETLLGKSFPWEPVLGNFAWKPVLRKPVLANTWELFLVTLLAGNLAWEPVLGNLCLGTWFRNLCVGTLLGNLFLGALRTLVTRIRFWLLRSAPKPLLWLKTPSFRC